MNISEAFIRRPIGTSLLMAGILVFGIVCYELLPVAALPTVDFPTISVTAKLPGASPDTMAASVATPLEEQFGSIPSLAQMTSTSGQGNTTITLQFDLDRNIDAAAGDVQTAINAASGLLPKDMPSPPTYKKTNPANYAIMIYAVWSDALPIYRVDDYAFTDLAQKMSSIPGVAEVDIAGQQQYAVHVQVNPLALAARKIGLEDVRNALVSATLDEPKGNLEGKNQVYALDTNDQLFNAASFAKTIIAYRNGAPVRVEDIGRTVNSSQSPRTASWYGNKRIELLLVRRAAGANTIAVVDAIKAEMPSLLTSIPKTIHVALVADRSQNIRDSVNDVQLTMLLTIALVVLVIFLFLHNVWATVIPSVVVPLSLVGTFGVMYVLGYSLDNLSLMALTISVGFVVDDAIVMIENIVRYLEQGMRPLEAALKGAGQIGFTIISITFSLISVFIPLLFMGGIVGRLFREFAVTVTTAVLVSAFVSLTLTPVMCSRFLTSESTHGTNFVSRWSEYLFDRMLKGYDRGLSWVFRHQFLMLTLTLTLIGVTGAMYVEIPKGFFPEQDVGFIFGQAEARQDASFASIAKIEHEFAAIIGADPAVSAVVGFAGATGGNATESTARLFIQLKPLSERGVSAQQIIQRLRPKVAKVEGAKFYMQAGQDIHIGGHLTKTEYQYTLTDTDSAELNHWAPILQHAMQKAPELQDVASDQQIASPHIAITVNRSAASRLGLSLSTIDQTLYDAFGERQIATVYTSSEQTKVILEVEPQFQNDPAALSRIYLTNAAGQRIPLSAIANFTDKVEPLTINHQGQFPAVTLSFNVAPGFSLGEAVSRIEAIQDSLRTPASLKGTFQGTAQEFQKSLITMPLLILAAIVVVYIVLGILYESYIHPITILSALPSAGVGALIMLRLFGYDLTVIAIIGIVLLIGIVKKNAIMMVDFALNAERSEGKNPLEAIHEACLLRFRPIMMTTMSALIAGLPLAIGWGAGSELRRPLGIAIVGGLLVSQALTLYTTPVMYLYLDRFSHWLNRRRTRHAVEVSGGRA
jgi:hydrophobe/amphiphile efflux-1 (HAE1) family protein